VVKKNYSNVKFDYIYSLTLTKRELFHEREILSSSLGVAGYKNCFIYGSSHLGIKPYFD
jgi:hypothetical protein